MNLIVDEQKLDRQQERAIFELTLKKQRSKKSTVSQKQVVAMQQLANELLAQRKSSLELLDLNQNQRLQRPGLSQKGAGVPYASKPVGRAHITSERYPSFKTTMCRCHSTSALLDEPPAVERSSDSGPAAPARQLNEDEEALNVEPAELAEEISSNDRTLTADSPQAAPTPHGAAAILNNLNHHHHHYKSAKELQRQSSTSTIATTSTSTSSVSSASSVSASSSGPAAMGTRNQQHVNSQILSNSSFISTTSNSSTSMSDEANIKLIQLRLEQLNNELERRLHQYEYLVAQEKSILGTYNLNLFRTESVNNFHLFARPNDQKNPL